MRRRNRKASRRTSSWDEIRAAQKAGAAAFTAARAERLRQEALARTEHEEVIVPQRRALTRNGFSEMVTRAYAGRGGT